MSPTRMASTKPRGPMPVNLPLTAKTIAHYPLARAVAGINVSVTAKGMLPLSSCKLTNSTTVACMQPTSAVDLVIFRTYRSLPALYAAYEARVSQLAQGPCRPNFGNCTETMTNGEIGWNHDFKHPSMYPMSEFTSGQITDDKAAGRVYCTFDDSDLYLVWTQDDGRMLGELSGAPHVDAYVWWRQVHHSIVIPGYPEHDGGDDGTDEQPLRDEYDEYDEHVGWSEHVEQDEHAGHEVVAPERPLPTRPRGEGVAGGSA